MSTSASPRMSAISALARRSSPIWASARCGSSPTTRARSLGLDAFGLEIVERVPIQARVNSENIRYLQTKRDRLGHLLDVSGWCVGPAAAG